MATRTRKPTVRAKTRPPVKATKKPTHRVIAPAPRPRPFGPAGGTATEPSATPQPVPPQVVTPTPKPRGKIVVAGNAAGSNPARKPVRGKPPVRKPAGATSLPARKPKKAP